MKIGALTSKPYAFLARPWEVKSIASLDLFDITLNSIIFSIRGLDVLRVLPLHSKVKFYWISDKTRFFYDALKNQRLLGSLSRDKVGKSLTFSCLLSSYFLSVINLWSYHPYDRRYHEITYIYGGEELPIPLEVVAGYPGMDNKSRLDFFNATPASFLDLINTFNLYWLWHPWLPYNANTDFRNLYLSTLDKIGTNTCLFFLTDFQYNFPSLFLHLRKIKAILNFTVGFCSRQEGFYSLGINSFFSTDLINFKHLIFSFLFDKNISNYTYFMSATQYLGAFKFLDLSLIFVPNMLSELISYELFGLSVAENFTNRPVDSVLRFSTSFLNSTNLVVGHNLMVLLNSHYFSSQKFSSDIVLLSTYTVFETGGLFLASNASLHKAEQMDLFLLQDKHKLTRFDDFLNFTNTLFYLIVRDYEHFLEPFYFSMRDDDKDLRFRNQRCPFWISRWTEEELAKLPRFFAKYKYFTGKLLFSDYFGFFSYKKSKKLFKPLFDNFFLTDSLSLNSPALTLAYKRFYKKSVYI